MRKLKKKLLTGVLAFTMLIGGTFSTMAAVNSETVSGFQEVKEISKEFQNLHFEEIDGKTFIKDKDGSIKYGLQYDNSGNLYYIDKEKGMIRSGTNPDGIYFDENGCFVNPSMANVELHNELAQKFDNGETLRFSNNEDLLSFLEYYSVQYRILSDADGYLILNKSDGTKEITIPSDAKYDREALKKEIIDKYGPIEGNTPYEKILDACQKVTNSITYDLDYIGISVKESIDSGKGVCRHYAKIVKVLLDAEGIENEIMIGNYNGSSHMWLRCFIDGEWVYTDPTAAKQMWWSYTNMPYELFVESYAPAKAMSLQ